MAKIRLLYAANIFRHEGGLVRQALDFRVLVENPEFEKCVEVHWAGQDGIWRILPAEFLALVTQDAELWHAHTEVSAPSAGAELPGDVSFAVRCRSASHDSWDNNHAWNHHVCADSGLRLAAGVTLLNTDFRSRLEAGHDFLPITAAALSQSPLRRVFVRWSTDRWRNATESDCYFWRKHWHGALDSAARNPNRYGTQVWITHLAVSNAFRIEYALGCETATGIHWDNQFGRNYLVRRPPLKVLTLNLHCYQEENQDAKFSLIAQAIRDLDIDVICFQEVAEPWNGGSGDWSLNSARLILERLGRPYHIHFDWSHIGFGRFREGSAILSRHPFRRTASHFVSPGHSPHDIHSRKIVMAQIDVPYVGLVNVFSAHLSWWDSGFREQFARLKQWFSTQASGEVAATLVCGDFNAAPQSESYTLANQAGDLVDQAPIASPRSIYGEHEGPPSLPAPPLDPKRIDYVFLRRGDRLAAVAAREIFTESFYGRVSDHTGYLVEFEPR